MRVKVYGCNRVVTEVNEVEKAFSLDSAATSAIPSAVA
jgi:hypothetical protein